MTNASSNSDEANSQGCLAAIPGFTQVKKDYGLAQGPHSDETNSTQGCPTATKGLPQGPHSDETNSSQECLTAANEFAQEPNLDEANSNPGCLTATNGVSQVKKDCGLSLTQRKKELIRLLIACQDTFESASEDDVKKVTPFTLGDDEWDSSNRIQHMIEITILTARLIIEHTGRIPGFDSLHIEDQIVLLKKYSTDVMILRSARKYDKETDSIIFANNKPYTKESFRMASMETYGIAIFEFCQTMSTMNIDDTEYAILTAIVMLSDSSRLYERKKVQKIREFYVDTFKTYTTINRSENGLFRRLQSLLDVLHFLGIKYLQHCILLKVHSKKLPPLFEELWDLKLETE